MRAAVAEAVERDASVGAVRRELRAPPMPAAAPPRRRRPPRRQRRAAPSAPAALTTAARLSIDARTWPDVVDAANLSGMVRQFALNCVPASFESDVLQLRLDASVAERRTRAIEEKLAQGLSKYLGRDIRIVFEVVEAAGLRDPSAAARHGGAGQGAAAPRPPSRRIPRSRA